MRKIIIIIVAILLLVSCYVSLEPKLILEIIDHGFFNEDKSYHVVELSCNENDAEIFLTLDGSSPNNSSTLYERKKYQTKDGDAYGILALEGSEVVAIATKHGYKNSTICKLSIKEAVDTPKIVDHGQSLDKNNYNVIEIICDTIDSNIMYAIDNDVKINELKYSPKYLDAISGSFNGVLAPNGSTIKAIALKDGYNESTVASYFVPYNIVEIPSIIDHGTYLSDSNYNVIEIECYTPDSTIRYTIDGDNPTKTSSNYIDKRGHYEILGGKEFGILVPKGSTLKVIGVKSGYKDSDVFTYFVPYGIVDSPRIIDHGVFTFDTNYNVVEIVCDTIDSMIKYTIDGQDPTNDSIVYYPGYYHTASGSKNGVLLPSGSVINAIATKTGYIDSEIVMHIISSLSRNKAINLNNQWEDISFDSKEYDKFGSFAESNSIAKMSITIEGYSTFSIKIMCDTASSSNYMKVYDLDSISSIKESTIDKQKEWIDVSFYDIRSGSHLITIEYINAENQVESQDKGYILIPKN